MPRPRRPRSSSGNEEEYPVDLRALVHGTTYARIKSLSGTNDALETIKRLCDAGYTEYVEVLLSRISGEAVSRGHPLAMPYSMYEKLVSCTVKNSDVIYLFLKTMSGDGSENIYCIAYEIDEKNMVAIQRPCSYNEYVSMIEKAKIMLMNQPRRTGESPVEVVSLDDYISGNMEDEEE